MLVGMMIFIDIFHCDPLLIKRTELEGTGKWASRRYFSIEAK